MNKLIFIVLLFFLDIRFGSAQDTTRHYHTLKRQLKTELSFLNDYKFSYNSSIDIDKYCGHTASKLVEFLSLPQTNKLNLKEFKNLNLSASTKDSIRVRIYDFGYHCGGSRGWITHSIVQWRGLNDKLCAYNLTKKVYCQFHEIYKLKSNSGNFYLLIGDEQGNSHAIQYIVYVVKFDGNRIFVNHKAFINRAYINFTDTEITFNSKTQILQLKAEEGYNESNNPFGGRYLNNNEDSVANKKLIRLLSREYDEPVCLKFNGSRFIRTKCR